MLLTVLKHLNFERSEKVVSWPMLTEQQASWAVNLHEGKINCVDASSKEMESAQYEMTEYKNICYSTATASKRLDIITFYPALKLFPILNGDPPHLFCE